MIPLYSGLATGVTLTIQNLCFMIVDFSNGYELQLWSYIFGLFVFDFWMLNVMVLVFTMHLLTNLLIFQSEVGTTQVEVKREEYFKKEKRIFKFYLVNYLLYTVYCLVLIIFALCEINSPEVFLRFSINWLPILNLV